ncbi:DUF2017 domain-containing protein [Brevibacterium sp. UMB1308A]|uniref:DUF2017 domain-containing protein n=1 Tax=Brevibacterium sp. UMB1308A TaxID=3050608 RepID=UPI0025516C9D|nr:DUF2017 domain-containing protein [Brevibacterium sp. UMB1308A]MDK8345887.1 DUF2017 domain-containing protein [Brevibacterium sp. UMB1308B]MDK8712883.1 DUF2017 domain-containing protein [Brevibacterium sp. UMB1308A]
MKITPSARFTAIVEVEPVERRLLAGLFSDAAELLGGDNSETEADELAKLVGMSSGERPTDPAVLRLLPDVDAEDSERATEFRRLTERDIRESKLANFRTALFTLDRSGRAELTEEQARAWATALGDVRLILATRLGIATESDLENLLETLDEQPESTVMTVNVYELLTWAQDRITTILLEALPDLGEDDEAGGNDLGNEGP